MYLAHTALYIEFYKIRVISKHKMNMETDEINDRIDVVSRGENIRLAAVYPSTLLEYIPDVLEEHVSED